LSEASLRVVLDPNVAVSALITPNGTTGQVVRAASTYRHHEDAQSHPSFPHA